MEKEEDRRWILRRWWWWWKGVPGGKTIEVDTEERDSIIEALACACETCRCLYTERAVEKKLVAIDSVND